MMSNKQKLMVHAAIEAEDRAHREWYLNSLMLDKLTVVFPPGTLVDNFGVIAEVVGYHARGQRYTGDLILEDLESGQRWIGKPEYCMAIA